jgi:RNA polymerase sigma factor (sigma-70 family)
VDKIFIEKCREGDKVALQQLYKYYAPRMKGICLRYVYSASEAEDIFQDSFIKVLKNLKSYSFKGSFDGWIKKIVINTAIDHYKKNHNYRNNYVSYEEVEETEQDTSEIADQLSANELLEIIKKLPHGYRLVFNLYAIEGYSHSEIAETLQISESSSRSQLCKARYFIKNILRHYEFVLNEKRSSQRY